MKSLQLLCLIVIWGLNFLEALSYILKEIWRLIVSSNINVRDYFTIVRLFFLYSKHLVFFWIITTKRNEIRELLYHTGSYASSHVLKNSAKQPISRRVCRSIFIFREKYLT